MLKEKNKTSAEESFPDSACAAVQGSTDPPQKIPDSDELNALIERAKAGDDDSFSELVGEFERFVYNTACRVLSTSGLSTDYAEDIAQTSFIKAWRNLSAFRGDCSFATWLFRITVNTARDQIRSISRRPTVSLTRTDDDCDEGEEWEVPVTSGDDIPEDSLIKKEYVTAVRRAIEALPPEQREVIVMRDIHELSYETISRSLGIGIGTVKSRINRGRANLKTIFEKMGIRK